MAEHVHHNLEGMLPELEEMERLNVFSRKEIRSIIKKRTDFEYRLQKHAPEKQDFIRYIQYEINLDTLKKKRKLNIGLKKNTKGEYEMVRRLHALFKKALQKFKHDTKLWLQYIEYCKKAGSTKSLNKVFGQLLQYHPHNPTFWVMAAKWEFEDSKNTSAARALLQRGLRMNSESKLLWLEYFRMEMLHVDKVMKRRSILGLADMNEDDDIQVTDAFLAGKAAEIVFKKAIQEIPDDFDFRLSFLKIYQLFQNTKAGQDLIFESLKEDFGDTEEYWNALAGRSMDDLYTKYKKECDPSKAVSERDKIFNEAVEKLPTEKMWDYYISALSDHIEVNSSMNHQGVEKCLNVCEAANKKKLLSSHSFKTMVRLLLMTGDTEKALRVSRERTSLNCTTDIYFEYLRLLTIHESDNDKITEEFWKALSVIAASESLLVWQLFLDWSISKNKDNVATIFEKCLESDPSVRIREHYLDWVVSASGIVKARQLYKRFCKERSASLSFLRKCVSLEQSQLSISMPRVRHLYDVMLESFGAFNSDCWIEYIGFELQEGRMESAGKLHWRAIKTLTGSELEAFVAKYSLLQAGHETFVN